MYYFCFSKCKLELRDVGGAVDHGTAFGRIAFSCPQEQVKYCVLNKSFSSLLEKCQFEHDFIVYILQLPSIEALMKKENQKILTPLVSLDTPGKATVEVVILSDPVSVIK